MNELINSQSPYLQQHAGNPVHWKMWTEDAFLQAKNQNKPVIVSIGYAACHWCHVMEKESFENENIAGIMNEHFICIKVDREELPHVDRFYMDALQSMQQHGGWPLNMFVTPDKKPFYGGTYFPPEQIYNRLSWRQVLESIITLWKDQNGEVVHQGNALTEHLANIQNPTGKDRASQLMQMDWQWHKTSFLHHYDDDYGGWYNAPKFPQFLLLNNLVLNYVHTADTDIYNAIRLFWENMITGGLYDSTEGGIFRYAVDNRWRIPHFEKMLYDNALCLESLALTLLHTDLSFLRPVLKQQVQFIQNKFRSPSGLFYTAFDADSEGVEGLYYLLTKEDRERFLACCFPDSHYNEEGIYHGDIPYYKINLEIVKYGIDDETMQRIRSFLMNIRISERISPMIDTKELLSQNALVNKAIISAYSVLDDHSLLHYAMEHFEIMQKHFFDKSEVFRIRYDTYTIQAQSDDIVLFINSAISLALMTDEQAYWDQALRLTNYLKEAFQDKGGAFLSQMELLHNDLPVTLFEKNDNIIPSANSLFVKVLRDLGLYFSDARLLDEAGKILQEMTTAILEYPQAYPYWLAVYGYVKEGSLLKIKGVNSSEIFHKIYQRYGISHQYSRGKSIVLSEKKSDEICIEQCFDDRCVLAFKGNLDEFEKYC